MNQSDYCILVAEDNVIMRYTLAKTLSENGYCVIEAGDGREAMRREAEYDGLIVCVRANARLTGGALTGRSNYELHLTGEIVGRGRELAGALNR